MQILWTKYKLLNHLTKGRSICMMEYISKALSREKGPSDLADLLHYTLITLCDLDIRSTFICPRLCPFKNAHFISRKMRRLLRESIPVRQRQRQVSIVIYLQRRKKKRFSIFALFKPRFNFYPHPLAAGVDRQPLTRVSLSISMNSRVISLRELARFRVEKKMKAVLMHQKK